MKHKPRGNGKPPTNRTHQTLAAVAKFSSERAARVLVEAIYFGTRYATSRNNVSARTIANWRSRLDEPELAAEFEKARAIVEAEWGGDVGMTLRAANAYIREAMQEESSLRLAPEMVHEVVEAMKVLYEAAFTRDLLNARLAAIKPAQHRGER